MVNTDNSLLNEKYRPIVLDDYVGNAKLKSSFEKSGQYTSVKYNSA